MWSRSAIHLVDAVVSARNRSADIERFVDWVMSPLGTRSLQARWRSLAFAPPWPPALCPSASDGRHHRRSAHPAGRTKSTSPHCPNACLYFTFHASRFTSPVSRSHPAYHFAFNDFASPSRGCSLGLSIPGLKFPLNFAFLFVLFVSVKNPGSSVRGSSPSTRRSP